MKYVTVYNSFNFNEIPALEHLFEENNLDYRIIRGPNNDTVPREGIKVQVIESEKEQATRFILDKGFKHRPPITQEESRKGKTSSKFWIVLFLIIFIIIVISVFVSRYMT